MRERTHLVKWYHWPPDYAGDAVTMSADFNLRFPGGSTSLADFRERSVAVFGLGAVGGEVLNSLAKLGVGRLLAVDPDHYEEGSWQTQPARPRDTGQPKAWIQGRRAHAGNPGVEVKAGIGRAQAATTQSTRTLSALCVTAAQLAVVECVKKLLALDEQSLESEEISYCLLTHQLLRSELPRHPQCRCPHQPWETIDVDESPSWVSLSSLASSIGLTQSECQIRGEAHWFSAVLCPACGASIPVRRFARGFGMELGACLCGEALITSPQGAYSILPEQDLASCWERPLPELGLGAGEAVGLSGGEGWTYFFLGGQEHDA